MLKTPILFIVFNRIDTAQRVFDIIKSVQPQKLYIACDGPRSEKEGEDEACKKTKDLILQINWPCEVNKMFLENNLGPSKAPFKFIKWFFSFEEQGIILEHDCLPNKDFFIYCELLLNHYKDNPQIGTISGPQFIPLTPTNNSYTYSIYNHIWGWATWKRTIDNYTLDFTEYSYDEFYKLTKKYFKTSKEFYYWNTIFRQIKKGEIPTWDYYLTFCLWRSNYLSISPNKNLVSNIGFGKEAINTTDPNSPLANCKTESILPLIFNEKIERNLIEENLYFQKFIMDNHSIYRLYIKLILKRVGLFKYLMKIKHLL